jgi:hypothetical protein
VEAQGAVVSGTCGCSTGYRIMRIVTVDASFKGMFKESIQVRLNGSSECSEHLPRGDGCAAGDVPNARFGSFWIAHMKLGLKCLCSIHNSSPPNRCSWRRVMTSSEVVLC